MTRKSRLRTAMAIVWLAAAGLRAADVKVIAHPGVAVSSISAEELKSVFLFTRTTLGGSAVVEPVLAKGGRAHELFLKEYLGRTDSALGAYYRTLVFTGKASMPKTLDTDADVVSYVAKTKGAIGYVAGTANTDGVKTLEVK